MSGPPGLLRLATYNVQGRFWGNAPSLVEDVLAEVGADFYALQEVRHPSSEGQSWKAPGGVEYRVVLGPTLNKGLRPFGNAILSRYPVTRVRRFDLSQRRAEPRGALEVEVDVDGFGLRVIATHLGLRARERIAQVASILERCEDRDGALLVLMGDINEWRRRGAALRRIERAFGPAPSAASFPNRWPVLALDRIWTRPRSALLSIEAHRTPRSVGASDHLPVVATIATDLVGRSVS